MRRIVAILIVLAVSTLSAAIPLHTFALDPQDSRQAGRGLTALLQSVSRRLAARFVPGLTSAQTQNASQAGGGPTLPYTLLHEFGLDLGSLQSPLVQVGSAFYVSVPAGGPHGRGAILMVQPDVDGT